jgi:hypothetical protein
MPSHYSQEASSGADFGLIMPFAFSFSSYFLRSIFDENTTISILMSNELAMIHILGGNMKASVTGSDRTKVHGSMAIDQAQ